LVLLAVEFLDELVFGAREASWPLFRADLDLSYTEVGLLLSLPFYASALLEPVFGLLGDTRWRRAVIVGGGVAFALSLGIVAIAGGFAILLIGFLLLFPAAGAFVSLSQATLMDLEPDRREHNMARWSVAGGIGAVAGPLLVGGLVFLGLAWRELFAAFAGLTLVLVVAGQRRPPPVHPSAARPSLRAALSSLRRPEVVRWLVLLEFADLMLDVLLGFIALYFVDVVGTSAAVGGLAVAVWTGAALAGGLGIVVMLRRIDGLRYLRLSALAAMLLYPALLLAPGAGTKLVLLALLGLATAGWYSIPKARLYGALPGQSGAVTAFGSLAGTIRAVEPLAIALVAESYGLDAAMWLLLAAPVALLVALPRR
jgi:FSR family fosmidomycin resistance protein-like MFS transporter